MLVSECVCVPVLFWREGGAVVFLRFPRCFNVEMSNLSIPRHEVHRCNVQCLIYCTLFVGVVMVPRILSDVPDLHESPPDVRHYACTRNNLTFYDIYHSFPHDFLTI